MASANRKKRDRLGAYLAEQERQRRDGRLKLVESFRKPRPPATKEQMGMHPSHYPL